MEIQKIRNLILNEIIEPTIFRDFINDWPTMKWSLEDWSTHIGYRILSFRVGSKMFSERPLWEGDCTSKEMSLDEFIAFLKSDNSKQEWCYFDYKHMIEWFQDNPKILKSVDWGPLGFPERRGDDSTLWIGSEGAHTPCHIDTYGCNLIAQIFGTKQWILFPPDSDHLQPTRVPYEESSIFSDINFYSPSEGLKLPGARVAVLSPGDVLFVPAGWWHYVETVSPAAISINTWIPLPGDKLKQVEEALVKILVSSVSRISTSATALLNPNEVALGGDSNLLEYVRRAVSQCDESVSQEPASKRARPSEEANNATALQLSQTVATRETADKKESCTRQEDLTLAENKSVDTGKVEASVSDVNAVNMCPVSELSEEQFEALMKQKRARFDTINYLPKSIQHFRDFELCKKIINAICDKQVLSLISNKLLQRR